MLLTARRMLFFNLRRFSSDTAPGPVQKAITKKLVENFCVSSLKGISFASL